MDKLDNTRANKGRKFWFTCHNIYLSFCIL
jgi:hypothetical protein